MSIHQRSTTVADVCKNLAFFCEATDSGIHLKTSHNYYYQVQGQMAVLNLPWCDFVVWTLKDYHTERIFFNESFWKDHCYPKLHAFYYGIILLELLHPRHPLGLDILDYRQYLS